jgi:hypothetical protein
MKLRSLAAASLVTAGSLLCADAAAQFLPSPSDGQGGASPRPGEPQLWNPRQSPPPGYHVERKVNRPFVIAGSVVFGVAYLGVVIPSFILVAHGTPSAALTTIPVGGPFYYVPGFAKPQQPSILILPIALDAATQFAGVAMLSLAIMGKHVLVPGPPRPRAEQLLPVPLVFGRSGAGVGVAGAF